MKKKLTVMSLLLAFSIMAAVIGCSSNKPSTQNTTPSQNPSSTTASKTFTLNDLKQYTGQNGTAAYVAVNGTVYDVTKAKRWQNGQHEGCASAGADLTDAMGNSPHGNSVLSALPIVGKLK